MEKLFSEYDRLLANDVLEVHRRGLKQCHTLHVNCFQVQLINNNMNEYRYSN
jgi:hypothetical protein